MRDFLRGFVLAAVPTAALSSAVLARPDAGAPESDEEAALVAASTEAPAPIEVPLDRVAGLCVAPRWEREGTAEATAREIRDLERGEIPLSVRVVDGVDGTPVLGARWAMDALTDPDGAGPIEGDAEIVRVSKIRATSGSTWAEIRALPRAGYVAWESVSRAPFSIYARAAVASIPLRREVPFELEFVTIDGRVAPGVGIEGVEVAGRELPARGEEVGPGRLRVPGVPFLPGEAVGVRLPADTLWVGEENRVVDDQWWGLVPNTWPARLDVRLRVSPRGAGRGISCGEEECFGCGCCGADGGTATDEPTGRLRVTARRHDGRRASFARVRMQRFVGETPRACRTLRLDREGTAEESVLPGRWRVRLAQTGLVETEQAVEVAEGELAAVMLVEDAGGSLEVTVQDGDGRRLPFARVQVVHPGGSAPWADLDPETDVQRLDDFTDERGERVLRRLPRVTVGLRASWGAKAGETSVDVRDGAAATATIVVK